MSKQNNLGDFLTDLANHIRTKKGTAAVINAQNMASEIDSIQTGITPSGSINITTNGTYDVTDKASAIVNVPSGGAELNIAYGQNAPTDTTKIWVKCSEPTKVKFSNTISSNNSISTKSATLPQILSGVCCGTIETDCYMFGGRGSSISSTSNTIYKYNTLTNTISTMSAALPQALVDACCGVVGTDCYIFGGSNINNNKVNTIYKYDTINNTVSTMSTTLPQAISNVCCGVVGTDCYMFGGFGSSGLNTIYKYNTLTNTISTMITALPQILYSACCGVVGTDCYIFGGYGSGNSKVNTIYKYNTINNTISTMSATLPQVLTSACCGTIGTDCYIFGGSGSGGLNTIYKYDTTNNIISTMSITLPQTLYQACCGTVGTDCYIFGGYNGSDKVNTIYDFTVAITLSQNNLLLVENFSRTPLHFISSDELDMSIPISLAYLGNSSNVGEEVEVYQYTSGSWVRVA